MSNDTSQSTAITKTSHAELDNQIALAATTLEALAEEIGGDLGAKVLEVSMLTSPQTKGIEGQQRVTIPQVYVRQPSSNSANMPADTKVGELYSVDGTIGAKLIMLPILTHEMRRKWSDGEGIDCQSADAVTGTKYGACAQCPYSRYVEGERTACSKGRAFYGVTPDLNALYKIEFLKSSAKAGNQAMRSVRPPALWSRPFEITTELKTGNNRKYYELKVAVQTERTSPDIMKVCDALHGFFKAIRDKALLSQQNYIERRNQLTAGAPNAAPAGDTIDVDTTGDVVDFSDGM
jgi:hypothetical protein